MKVIAVVIALLLAGAAYADNKSQASTGTSTVQGAEGIDLAAAFKRADIDGDGSVSKAEAAGNERLVVGFDRADKDHDGQLSRQEFDSIYQPKPEPKAQAKSKARAPKASTGAPKASTGAPKASTGR